MYESYLYLITNYTERLNSKEKLNEYETVFLKSKIEDFIYCTNEIKIEIKNKWDGKSIFSREYIFQITKILNRPLLFELRPNSVAYKLYGKTIVGCGIYDDSLEKELLANLITKPPINTNGNVRIEVTVPKDIKKDKIDLLKTKGIETIDIFQVQGTLI